MSIDQLAEWLGVSRRFVNYQMSRGYLRKVAFTRHVVRVLPEDVAEWIANAKNQKERPARRKSDRSMESSTHENSEILIRD
jgi:helix-turn-helix protein